MVKKSFDSLGITIAFEVPETVEEFNALDAKRPNACLAEGINNVAYRSMHNQFRSKFVPKVVEATGYKPEVDKDDNWLDSDRVVFKKALAHAQKTPEAFQALGQSIADEIKFDPTASERGSGLPKKIAKEYYDAADKVIAAGKQEAVAAKLKELLSVEVGTEREDLARAISANEARKRAIEKARVAQATLELVV